MPTLDHNAKEDDISIAIAIRKTTLANGSEWFQPVDAGTGKPLRNVQRCDIEQGFNELVVATIRVLVESDGDRGG